MRDRVLCRFNFLTLRGAVGWLVDGAAIMNQVPLQRTSYGPYPHLQGVPRTRTVSCALAGSASRLEAKLEAASTRRNIPTKTISRRLRHCLCDTGLPVVFRRKGGELRSNRSPPVPRNEDMRGAHRLL